ncbi:cation diffusion facilitator family transporter [Acidihalobacter ferrooxydans]|uniref:Uncharacterized protein n=1 Tax=Acidihalobacter ferrooxydans TaxID=1765967 RepID=A0A1P8UJJ4_9GAMM|nr:cation diffusion facilitator family transporter [Acidihalobacter ferrooxydans]APZ43999.1 hypothetical protein BW247_13615 [Acidihalobacter ferrooxydans]
MSNASTANPDIDLEEREKRRWMLASTGFNSALGLAKFAWAWWSGSLIVMADAVHSLSDVIGALLVYAAVRFSTHRSARFPLGLHKLEDMAAVLSGLAVLAAAYEILRSAFDTGHAPATMPFLTSGFIAVLLLLQIAFYLAEKKAADRLGSPGLRSDAVNWLGDIGAGVVVIVGVIAHGLGIPYAQQIAVGIIVLLILHGAWEVLRDGLLSLLDAAALGEEREQVMQLFEHHPGIQTVRNVILRRAGSALFLAATVEVLPTGLKAAHEVIDQLETALRAKLPRLETIAIHFEPATQVRCCSVSLYEENKQTLTRRFGHAAWLLLEENATDGSTPQQVWIANPYRDAARGKGIKLAAWLIRLNAERVRFASDTPLDPALAELLESAGITLEIEMNSTDRKTELPVRQL